MALADLKDRVIGGFKVLRAIQAGAGSQGTVYKAECVEDVHGLCPPGTMVALKVMAVQDDGRDQWHRLERRTRDLSALDHPNVVRYLGCFAEQGDFTDLHVVVQEFLRGETMKERLSRHPSGLDADEALAIVDGALAGLEYTASKGIVHRDVKPGNIFVCLGEDGSLQGVKLIDFELAKQQDGSATTSTGNIRGSFDYMAPDFTDPAFHGDAQSDVFSMGVVLHEALTGKTPYLRVDAADSQANFVWLSRWSRGAGGESPIRISGRVKRLLANVDEVLVRALAPNRAERYAGFGEFRGGLSSVRYRELAGGAGRYRLLQFVGKGGFGEVFRARSLADGRIVAVKHLLKNEYAERFRREAKIMKRLDDPCFVRLVDFFELEGGGAREAFIVMDYLEGMPGSSLRDAIRSAKGSGLPRGHVLAAFERYARGLAVMHAQGLVHRDIKPSNLYYPAGRPSRAAIMDFGIARDEKGSVTTGMVPCTLDYMPPELVVTDSRGDSSSDIYALGLCLYEALSGRTAFPRLPAGSAAYPEFFARARRRAEPAFDDDGLRRDAAMLELLRGMTAGDPARRIGDASLVAARLRAMGESAGDGAQETCTEPETVPTNQLDETKMEALVRERDAVRERRRASRVSIAALCALVIAAAVGAALYFGQRFREGRRIRLPAPLPASPSAPAVQKPKPPPVDPGREAEMLKKAREEAERKAQMQLEARLAEERRKLEEERARVEAERRAEVERLARIEAERRAEVERLERIEAERKAAAERVAAERKAAAERAEEERKRREAAEAEAARKAAEEAEAKRLAEEKRKAEAEARRRAEEEARIKRLADEQAKLDAIARKIAEAEEAARKAEERRRAEDAARRTEAARRAADASAKAAKAREMYEFEEYRDAVRLFHEAKSGGYELTASDMEIAESAYKAQKKRLDTLIDTSYRLMRQGRATTRPVKDIEDERSELVSRYREIRSSR